MTRLINTVVAQLQLLDAIAALPAGQKLPIPRLRDALVNQQDVLDGIRTLIAAGELDPATLRPPIVEAGATPQAALLIYDEPLVIEESTPADAAGDCGPPDTRPTGADLAAQIDALMERDPTVSKSLIGKALSGSTGGVEVLRRTPKPHVATIAKVQRVLADPPHRPLPLDRVARPNCRTPHDCTAPARGPCRRCFSGTFQRGSDRIRAGIRATAEKRIEQGLSAGSAASANVRTVQLAIEERNREEARLADPIEQAKALLRRRHSPVCNAEVTGGPAGHFIVGRRTVDRTELLAMAARVAAVVPPPSMNSTAPAGGR